MTGSDSACSYTTDASNNPGIHVLSASTGEFGRADIVIYSAAIAKSNPRRVRAEELGIPQMERATLDWRSSWRAIATPSTSAGTHGKTTTTSMIAEAMLDTGSTRPFTSAASSDYIRRAPASAGTIPSSWRPARVQRELPQFHPTIAVITNIEEDHLDFYKDIDDIAHAFARFCALLPGKRRVHRQRRRPARGGAARAADLPHRQLWPGAG